MKRICLLLLLSLAVLPLRAGTIVTDSLASRVLGATVKYNVYLPDGYGKSDHHYPVVYLLHGLSDDYTAWEDRGRMQTVTDELIRSGEARSMVIIMPNAGGEDIRNVWNGYFNMPGWNYEDFFFGELLPAVREHSALDFLDSADEKTLGQLRSVAWFIDCGDDDFLLHLSTALHGKMKQAGVHSELRVRDGVHNWEYWHLALRLALPFASRNFK